MLTKPEIIVCDLGEVLLFPAELTEEHQDFDPEKRKMNPVFEALEKEGTPYEFEKYFRLNTELLEHLKSLKQSGVKLVMLTEGRIQKHPKIRPQLEEVFSEIYSAKNDFENMKKDDPTLYIKLSEKLTGDPSKMLFIDDSGKNTAAAEEAGLKVMPYTDNAAAIELLSLRENEPSREGAPHPESFGS